MCGGQLEVVEERQRPDAIEMKIDPSDAAQAHEVGGPVPHASPDEPPGDRRQLVAVATAVGVVSLLLGWVIGFAGRSEPTEPAAATSPVTTGETVVETTVPETMPMPTTTRPRRTTTTTTLAPTVVEPIELDPRLPPMELSLVGGASNGSHQELLELDLGEGTLTRTDLGRVSNFDWMMAGDDWVLVVTGQGRAHLIRDGEPPGVARHGEIWEARWDAHTGRYWRPDWDWDGPDGPEEWAEYDLDDEPTGATITIPFGAWPRMLDPRGGLVVETVGKHFSADASGASLIGEGHLLGLSADVAVFWDCDAEMVCAPYVVDRTTGDRRRIDVDLPSDEGTQIEGLWGWGEMASATVSPQGDACAIMLFGRDRSGTAVLDLETGAIVELGEPHWMPAIAWSPDARFVFFVGGEGYAPSELRVFDRESGEIFPVLVEPIAWAGLSARPISVDE